MGHLHSWGGGTSPLQTLLALSRPTKPKAEYPQRLITCLRNYLKFIWGRGEGSSVLECYTGLKVGKTISLKPSMFMAPTLSWSVHESALYRNADVLCPAMLVPTQADGDHASLAKSRQQLELVRSAGAARHSVS